jgi:hypothetical protein
MNIDLESMAVEMPAVEGHPNRVDFRGVLTVVDVPSQRAPGGAKGRRVILTREAAQAALPSLIGMALDYSPAFDGHDARRKVGIITEADVVGRNLEVGGYFYAKDFPDVVEEVSKFGRKSGDPSRNAGVLPAKAMRTAPRVTDGTKLRASLVAAVSEIRGLMAGVGRKRTRGGGRLRGERSGADAGLGMSFEVTNVNVLDQRARIWILTEVTFTGAAVLRKNKAAYQDTWIELA